MLLHSRSSERRTYVQIFPQLEPPKYLVSILTSTDSTLLTTHCVHLVSMRNICIVNLGVVSIVTINFEGEFVTLTIQYLKLIVLTIISG